MDELLFEISKLRLIALDSNWVQAINSSEFLEFNVIPIEYEEILETLDINIVFKDITKAIDDWLNSELARSQDKSWSSLSMLIPYDKLIAILAYYIYHGNKNMLSKEDRENALIASRLYYKLITIPGYNAFHIYHSQLFVNSLECLSYPKAMCEGYNYFNSRELTIEVNSLIKKLKYFVLDLKDVIQLLQLNTNDMNFEDILTHLVDFTGSAIVNKLNVDRIALSNLSNIIYEIIDILLCDTDAQPDDSAVKLIFKCLLPKVLTASADSKSANNIVRASYVSYSGLLLSKYGKMAVSGYIVLLEHICFNTDGLERAEARTARVSLVVGLMSLLPRKSYRKFIRWLLELTSTVKIYHRLLSLEILSILLSNEPELPTPDETPPHQNNDSTNSDSQNADESLSRLLDSGIDVDTTMDQQNFTMSTDDESSQDTLEMDNDFEEDAAELLAARAHRVPHLCILRAVMDCGHDMASSVRMRALQMLTECLSSKNPAIRQAINELNGTGKVPLLMLLGARLMCDERAVVRRAAVGLVHRLLITTSSLIEHGIEFLVSLCRDGSITVRSAAITAMGELLLQTPTKEMFNFFLIGPMNQLSDPETKIQEQVVLLMKGILLDKLECHTTDACNSPFPWQLLATITTYNMRRLLQKACSLLALNTNTANSMNHRIVDILSTHLGEVNDHDLHCLVLLTSLARHIEYSDIRFVLDYYFKLTRMEECDDRILALTLELLSMWCRFVSHADRQLLKDFLVHMASVMDDGCRIPSTYLAAQLDPENIIWASELMIMAERHARMEAPSRPEEWLRAADMSLVALRHPHAQLLQAFLAALMSPPTDWPVRNHGMCVAGVGRLCLRSRDTAVESAPRLAAMLSAAIHPLPARINALFVLSDICTRYASIVEPLLESVCGCLSVATGPPLRKAATRSLTRLLLGGYLRLRTPLYYRFCALMADDDLDVREPAQYYITSCLTTNTIYHHFVDCVLYYNKEDLAKEAKVSFDERQLIYDVMLQRLSMVQKLNVQCRLAREVVAHAADVADEQPPHAELPATLHAALLDTITLLCSPRMKLSRKPQNSADAEGEDIHERVASNIVSHKMKVTVAEVVVPAVLRLYAHLRTRGGQLAAYLVRIATDLLNDYRQEIEELFENNEELVERVAQFQATIKLVAPEGNARNLVTASAPPEPETPRSSRRRPAPPARGGPPPKRTLRF